VEPIPPGIVSISDWHNDDPSRERTSAADARGHAAVAHIS
jgi:hypothetical protein